MRAAAATARKWPGQTAGECAGLAAAAGCGSSKSGSASSGDNSSSAGLKTVTVGVLLDEHGALVQELAGDRDRLVLEATRVAAHVEEQAPGPFLTGAAQGLLQLGVGP